MSKLPIIPVAAAVALAACAGHEVRPAPAAALAVPAPVGYVLRPGLGRVTAISAVVYPNSSRAAMQQLTLLMDDGSIQVVDTRGPRIAMGERVEITADRNIRYPLASSR
jgi:hypothetical protein